MEALTAVAILSIGIIIVFRPLLTGLGAIAHLDYRMAAMAVLERELWDLETQIKEKSDFEIKDRDFVVSEKTKIFNLKLVSKTDPNFESLKKVEMTVSWLEGDVKKKMIREALFSA